MEALTHTTWHLGPIATAIESKDEVTHGHVRRVQAFSLAMARYLGVTDPKEIQAIELPVEIALVFSDKPDSGAVSYARQHDMPCKSYDVTGFKDRSAFDASVAERVSASSSGSGCLTRSTSAWSTISISRFRSLT